MGGFYRQHVRPDDVLLKGTKEILSYVGLYSGNLFLVVGKLGPLKKAIVNLEDSQSNKKLTLNYKSFNEKNKQTYSLYISF